MAEPPLTVFSAFSRLALPTALFNFPAEQDSMLLAQRYAKPVVQHLWKKVCESANANPSPAVESLDTTSRFLGGNLASMVILLPPPRQPGEAYFALFIVPARPDDGPRRYFTLEIGDSPAENGNATVMYEWLAANERGEYEPVRRADGIEASVEAFAVAVERLTGSAPQPSAPKPAAPQPPPASSGPLQPAIAPAPAKSATEPTTHIHCKSILIARQQANVQSQRQAGYVRTTTTTDTSYRMDTIQEHHFDIADAAIRQKAKSIFLGNSIGPGTIVLVAVFLGVAALTAVAVLTMIVWFVLMRATGEKEALFLPSLGGAAVILLLLAAWLVPPIIRGKFAAAMREAKKSLMIEAVRKERGLPPDALVEAIPIEDWEYFAARLTANN